MDKRVIGLLFGGTSSEHEVSIGTGKEIFKYLNRDKFDVVCIEWTVKNEWIEYETNSVTEIKKVYVNILELFSSIKVDIVFIALHGINGEDGKIQGFFELANIKYIGSGVLSSGLCLNKQMTKQILLQNGINTPKYLKYGNLNIDLLESINEEIVHYIGYPCIAKANSSGSSIGVCKVNNFSELKYSLEKLISQENSIIIEEFISGMEISVGVLGDYNKESKKVLPIIEVIPESDFFDEICKHNETKVKTIIPARINDNLKLQIEELALKIYEIFNCKGYSRIDIMIDENKIYVLEINTLPGMSSKSFYPKMAFNIGIQYPDLLEILIETGLEKYQ